MERWSGKRSKPRSSARGFRPGICAANAVHVLHSGQPYLLGLATGVLFATRAAAHKRAWDTPNLRANAARVVRGPWCFAASPDRTGLAASQQLFGIRPNGTVSLEALAAVLNGPVAVAFIATHSPPDRIRVTTLVDVPLPRGIPSDVTRLVKQYQELLREESPLLNARNDDRLVATLNEIDATVLSAYDLPPRMERQVLEYFRAYVRPTAHRWAHWFPEDFAPFIPLHRFLSDEYKVATSGWVLDVFKPLPKDEFDAIREYLN